MSALATVHDDPATEARILAARGLISAGFTFIQLWGTRADGTCRCPMGRRCDRKPGKHPLTESTADTWHTTTDPDAAETMLRAGSRPNYGVLPPVGALGWDIDGEAGPRLDALAVRLGPLPGTYGHLTRNGRHAFYRWPAHVERPHGGNLFGIITRWANDAKGRGYVVGPYSQIGDFTYRPDGRPTEIAELPEAWARAAAEHEITVGRPKLSEVQTGDRHPQLRDLAYYLAKRGFDGDALRAVVDAANAALPEPKSRREVDAAIGDLSGVEPDDDVLVAPADAGSIGTRTAADLDSGPPPPQLADPFLTTEGVTILYGPGGTGKGVTTCWLIQRLVASGQIVMILDYEHHQREWGSRLRGLGMTDDELARVHYRAPFATDWTADTGALAKVATLVREDVDRLGITYLVVDSYSVSTSNGDTMGGETAAREFFTGITRIGIPALVIAHVSGSAGRFPARPFGSVFVHNLARETWAVEALGDEPETDPDLLRVGPKVVSLELRNPKMSAGPKVPPQFVTFSFHLDGTIGVDTNAPDKRPVGDLIAAALAGGPLTSRQIVVAILDDTGDKYTEATIRQALNRDRGRFVHGTEGKPPRPWALR